MSEYSGGRRALTTAAAAVMLVGVALAAVQRPLHAAAANTNACGTLWSDSSSDANDTTGVQADQLDIVSGAMSDNGSALTTTLTIKNLSSTVANGGTANEYYFVWGFNGTNYYTNAEESATGTTYSYGTYSGTGFSGVGSATGTFTTGAAGAVTVTVPFSAVGNPATGDVFTAAGIVGQTGQLTGAAGSGLVSTSDKDTSAYDYQVGQTCGSGSTPTPAPTPTPSSSTGGEANLAENGFTGPVEIRGSAGLGEPTLAHDSQNRLFVTAPQSIGNVQTGGGSPLFTSTNGGAVWGPPVRSQACTGLNGGDTDLAIDGADNVYATDLWLGNSCLSVSEDHGASFTAGNPFGSELQPGDDRPWLAYNRMSNQDYIAYDGFDALHAANTGPLANPAVGIQTIQDNVVVPESVASGTGPSVRDCVCPPGGIAVDNSSGSHAGRVYVSYSHQNGTAISYADLSGTCPACTATTWTGPIVIPGTGSSGSAFENEWNFDPIKVDGSGTVYVVWGHGVGFGNNVASGGVQVDYAYSKDGGTTWSNPVVLSTEGGATTFPTLDVVGPGVIDVAWYGDPADTTDPNSVPATASWNVYDARVSGADTTNPSFTPQVAIQGMHVGCIQTGGGKSCTDRSLLDFFTVSDVAGQPNIIYTEGDAINGVNLFFTRLAATPPPSTPEVPWVPLMLIPAVLIPVLGIRRRRRGGTLPMV